MASITIRNLDEQLKQKLRLRAATHLRSMEDEVRNILRAVLAEEPRKANFSALIRDQFKATGGVELELPVRTPMREPPEPLAKPRRQRRK
jgi:antitoxin FitA